MELTGSAAAPLTRELAGAWAKVVDGADAALRKAAATPGCKTVNLVVVGTRARQNFVVWAASMLCGKAALSEMFAFCVAAEQVRTPLDTKPEDRVKSLLLRTGNVAQHQLCRAAPTIRLSA